MHLSYKQQAHLFVESWTEWDINASYGLFTPPTRQFCLVRVGGVTSTPTTLRQHTTHYFNVRSKADK